MTEAILQRLFWKEFRVQRAMWIALLVAALGLQVLVTFFMRMPGTQANFQWVALFYIGALFAWIYALAAGAVGYSIEREDETHIRLVTLVCPPFWTAVVKITTGVVGTLGLLVLTTISAYFFSEVRLGPGNVGIHEFLAAGLAVISTMFLTLAASLYVSLYASRPLYALIAAGIFCPTMHLFCVVVTTTRFGPTSGSAESMVSYAISQLVIAALFFLCGVLVRSVNWMNRDFISAPRTRWLPRIRFVQVQPDGTIVVPIERREESVVLSPEAAVMMPPPRRFRWSSIWLFGSGRLRVWRFLIWRELTETRRWCWLLLPLLFFISLTITNHYEASGLLFFACLYATSCGLMTFQQEQKRDQFLFLTYRGIAPFTVWWTKHAAWMWRLMLGLAFLILVPILGIPRFLDDLLAGFRRFGMSGHPNVHWGDIYVWATYRTPLWVLLETPSTLLASYAIGQTASLLVRRAIVSVFTGAMGASLLFAWLTATAHLGVSPLLTTVPLLVGLIATTALHCRAWMLRYYTKKVWARLWSTLLFGPCLALGLVVWFRVTEIPVPVAHTPEHLAPPLGSWHDRKSKPEQYAEQIRALTAPPSEVALRNGNEYRIVLQKIRSIAISRDNSASAQASDSSELNLLIDQLVKIGKRNDCSFDPLTEHSRQRLSALATDADLAIDRILASARRELDNGQNHAQAIEKALAALWLLRDIERRATMLLSNGRFNSILTTLIEVAAQPATSNEQIDQLIAELIQYRDQMPTPEAYLHVNTQLRLRLIERDPAEWFDGVQNETGFLVWLPGEQARLRRYVLWNFDLEQSKTMGVAFEGNRSSRSAFDVAQHLRPLHEVERSSYMESTFMARYLPSNTFDVSQFVQRDVQLKGTLIALALIADYRGRPAPRELTLKRNLGFKLTDPSWPNLNFDWWPDGLPDSTSPRAPSGIDVERLKATKPAGDGVPFLVGGQGRFELHQQKVREHTVQTSDMGATAATPFGMPGVPAMPGAPNGVPTKTREFERFQIRMSRAITSPDGPQVIIPIPQAVFAVRSSDIEPAWKSRISGPLETVDEVVFDPQ